MVTLVGDLKLIRTFWEAIQSVLPKDWVGSLYSLPRTPQLLRIAKRCFQPMSPGFTTVNAEWVFLAFPNLGFRAAPRQRTRSTQGSWGKIRPDYSCTKLISRSVGGAKEGSHPYPIQIFSCPSLSQSPPCLRGSRLQFLQRASGLWGKLRSLKLSHSWDK